MIDWYVFDRDDPDTWPTFDCWFLVHADDALYICKYDKILKCFYDNNGFAEYWDCYYSYITYVPKGHKVYHPIKCLNDDNCKIGCADNGYCIYDFCECEQQKIVNEYEIIPRLIVKEFEEG